MLLRQLFEAKARRIVAVMPGGFHPFHPGHKSLYDWAVKTFGQANVYIAATNDTKARPFPFEVKKKLAAMAGVPESNFMQVKSPFNNKEYAELLDADTALVFVRSQKDKAVQPLPDQTKKNGDIGYLRTYTGKDLNTSDEMGYMAYGPTIDFDFSGMQIKSASELRAAWPEMSDEDKLKAAKLMYGNGAPVAVKLLNQALSDNVAAEDASPEEEDDFHTQLDKLVHKYFGHSSDEKKKDKDVEEKERVMAPSLSGDTKSFRGTANRLPTDNTAGAKDITKKAKQADMPSGSYELDFDNLDKEKLKKVVAKLIPTLNHKKNEMVLRARFGLAPFEREYTFKQIADAMGVTPEVIRQREATALRQLRHPEKSRELRQFFDDKRR